MTPVDGMLRLPLDGVNAYAHAMLTNSRTNNMRGFLDSRARPRS